MNYFEIDAISNSWLSKFEYLGAKAYKRAIDNGLKDESGSLDLGDAFHTLMLEPDQFDSRILISEAKPVEGFMGEFIKIVAREFSTVLNGLWIYNNPDLEKDKEKLQEINKTAGFKQGLSTTWNAFQKEENQNYLKQLIESKGKVILSKSDMDTLDRCKRSIFTHKAASVLLDNSLVKFGHTVMNEKVILWPLGNIGCKSKLDRIIIDPYQGIVIVPDIKTTSKNVHSFKGSYEYYRYYRQMAFYRMAVKQFLLEYYPEWSHFEIQIRIVAVQTTGSNECVVYVPSESDLKRGEEEILRLTNDLDWHLSTGNWDYPRSYYEGNGTVELKLDVVEEQVEDGSYKGD